MIVESEQALIALAQRLSADLGVGSVVALCGDLGVGKTTFARAVIRALAGDETLDVPSPSFALVQQYDTPLGELVHVDAYRLGSVDELIELGLEEAFARAVVLIEWPERLGGMLPCERIDMYISDLGGERREIEITGWRGD